MPFYVRKAFKFGPFRFNLSKSGVGTSVGVKGLRVGEKPDGQSVSSRRERWLYLRENLGTKPKQFVSGNEVSDSITEPFFPEDDPPRIIFPASWTRSDQARWLLNRHVAEISKLEELLRDHPGYLGEATLASQKS